MILQKQVEINNQIIKLILAKAELENINDLTGPDKRYTNRLISDNEKAEVWLKNSKPK